MRPGIPAGIFAVVLATGLTSRFSAADPVAADPNSSSSPNTTNTAPDNSQTAAPATAQAVPSPVTTEAAPLETSGNNARVALDIQLPEVKFNNIGLSDALDFLRDATGANFNVDWKALETVNIDKGTPVSLTLHSISMSKALELVLGQASAENLLTYYVDDNVIEVTTLSTADSKMITVVYDVEDLIAIDDNFNPTASSGSSISLSSAGGSGGGGGGSSSIFSNSNSSNSSNGAAGGGNGKDAKADKLIKLIESTIRPEIWKDNGPSGRATIIEFNDKLIVTAPRSVQEQINGPIN
jgi:hypothetical protein